MMVYFTQGLTKPTNHIHDTETSQFLISDGTCVAELVYLRVEIISF